MSKYFFSVIVSLFFCCCSIGQSKFLAPDKSPLDISYCPNNYPILKIQDKTTGNPIARVIYSRPNKNNRVIFGDLIEYNKVWRMGANEATEIEFFQNVKIYNHKIKKGRYTLYCIPFANKWTIILNSNLDVWGSFKYNEKNDLFRVDAPIQKQTETIESLSFLFEKTDAGYDMKVGWDDVLVSIPITL